MTTIDQEKLVLNIPEGMSVLTAARAFNAYLEGGFAQINDDYRNGPFRKDMPHEAYLLSATADIYLHLRDDSVKPMVVEITHEHPDYADLCAVMVKLFKRRYPA